MRRSPELFRALTPSGWAVLAILSAAVIAAGGSLPS